MHKAVAIYYLHFPYGFIASQAQEEWDRLKKYLQTSKAQTHLLVTQAHITDYNQEFLVRLETRPRETLTEEVFKLLQELDDLAPQLAKCIFVARHNLVGSINCLASYCSLRLITRSDVSVGCDEFRYDFFLPLQYQSLAKPQTHGIEFGYTTRFFAGEHNHVPQWQFDPIPSPGIEGDDRALLERVHFLRQFLPSQKSNLVTQPTTREPLKSFDALQHLALVQLQKHKSPYLAYVHLGRKRNSDRRMELVCLATWFAQQAKSRGYQSFLRRHIWSQAWKPAGKNPSAMALVRASRQGARTSSSVLEVNCHPEYLPPHSILHFIRIVDSLLIRTEELDHAVHYGNVMQSELEKNYKPAWAKQLWQNNLALSVGQHGIGSLDFLSIDLENWMSYVPASDKMMTHKCKLMGYSTMGVPILENTGEPRLMEQMLWGNFFHTGQSRVVIATGYCTTDLVRFVVMNEFLRLNRDFKISFGPLLAALSSSEAQANQARQQWQKFAHNSYRPLRDDPRVASFLQDFAPPSTTNYQNILSYMDSSSTPTKDEWSATLIKRHLSMLLRLLQSKFLAEEQDSGILFWASGLNLDWVHWTEDWSHPQQQNYVGVLWPHIVHDF